MPTIVNPVAKINATIAEDLKDKYPDIDIIGDGLCQIIMNDEDAQAYLLSTDYSVIEFSPLYVGSPIPKKRPRQ